VECALLGGERRGVFKQPSTGRFTVRSQATLRSYVVNDGRVSRVKREEDRGEDAKAQDVGVRDTGHVDVVKQENKTKVISPTGEIEATSGRGVSVCLLSPCGVVCFDRRC